MDGVACSIGCACMVLPDDLVRGLDSFDRLKMVLCIRGCRRGDSAAVGLCRRILRKSAIRFVQSVHEAYG